jgi:hypothetical protein
MTCLEKYLQDHPKADGGYVFDNLCPNWDECGNLIDAPDDCDVIGCVNCWTQQIPGTEEPHIRDSGNRTVFPSGGVRDIQKGKGRCDLMPLRVVALVIDGDAVLDYIGRFQDNGDIDYLYLALRHFAHAFNGLADMLLEVSKHFEEGAEKYGENNWQKGLPAKCYINSGVRHYLKWLRGDKDEFHDRAFCWNIICAIWTCKHRPELNDYAPGKLGFNPDDFIGEYEEEND